ncbi:hypothetical protein DL96DRAFT_1582827 [Flagelloscypha sp. PMI_526]|nr:hypothetical protein DL96DRAFT_1582827 [Flagelloscypha sp. PMI_526]
MPVMISMSSTTSELVTVPFSHFVKLVAAIASVKPTPKRKSPVTANKVTPEQQAAHWVRSLKEFRLDYGSWGAILRLLFPEDDVQRRYGMQEPLLLTNLIQCLGIRNNDFEEWEKTYDCLGSAVKAALERSCPIPDESSYNRISVLDVDSLLDELSASSGFTDSSVRSKHLAKNKRSRIHILSSLFRPLTPLASAVIVQIILHDLRPLLYPLPPDASHYTSALTGYNSNSVHPITKEEFMFLVEPTGSLHRFYKRTSNIKQAAELWQREMSFDPGTSGCFAIPKSQKGRGCRHTLSYFGHEDRVWVETKYDGERAQIHVRVNQDGRTEIKIFSKSHRDSTWDRFGVHDIIKDALGLVDSKDSETLSSVVLDAEMVAFDGEKIDEFWRIESLIKLTALGCRAGKPVSRDVVNEEASQVTDTSPSRHLGLVFFDILSLNGKDLLHTSYEERRALLEEKITTIPGQSQFSSRWSIDMNSLFPSPVERLKDIFSRNCADHHEGLVLKGAKSIYGDLRSPWVKLKKDYIPGLGDCIDLLVLGAGFDKERAMELKVPADTFTTFYIGALSNKDQVRSNPSIKPNFYIYFTASYGLSREQLEAANFLLKNSDHIDMQNHQGSVKTTSALFYGFKLRPGLVNPRIILQEPLVVELLGGGYTKPEASSHYALRWPRITKLHRRSERSWRDCMSLDEVQQLAREECGRNRPNKDIDDAVNLIWDHPSQVSPGVRSTPKRKRREEETKRLLDDVDPPSPNAIRLRDLENHQRRLSPVSEQEEPYVKQRAYSIQDESDSSAAYGHQTSTSTAPIATICSLKIDRPAPSIQTTSQTINDSNLSQSYPLSALNPLSPGSVLDASPVCLLSTLHRETTPYENEDTFWHWKVSPRMLTYLNRSVVWFPGKQAPTATARRNGALIVSSWSEFLKRLQWIAPGEVESVDREEEAALRGLIFVDLVENASQQLCAEALEEAQALMTGSQPCPVYLFNLNVLTECDADPTAFHRLG